jgi:hypothetical protein
MRYKHFWTSNLRTTLQYILFSRFTVYTNSILFWFHQFIDLIVILYYFNFFFFLDLKSTKGIPFEYQEPALKFATPKQLYRIEKNNLYLIQYTSKLWEYHTKKHFWNEYPGSDETWRDVYLVIISSFLFLNVSFMFIH